MSGCSKVNQLCKACWENPKLEHADHHADDDRVVVTGKVCAPPTMTEQALRDELDRALDRAPDVRLFVPRLTRAAGDSDRAEVEERRMAMIRGA